MQFAYHHLHLNAGDTVEIMLDRQAFVLLLEPSDFHCFQRGDRYHFRGGLAQRSPCHVTAPSSGTWYVVIHLGPGGGTIRHSLRVLQHQ